MLVCVSFSHFAHGTAGAARIRHSPRPLILVARKFTQTSGASRRGIEIPCLNCMSELVVIASNRIRTARRNRSELPLPLWALWDRLGMRGYGLSIERNPSPVADFVRRHPLPQGERGTRRPRASTAASRNDDAPTPPFASHRGRHRRRTRSPRKLPGTCRPRTAAPASRLRR